VLSFTPTLGQSGVATVMEQFNVFKLTHFQILILKGVQFKVYNYNYNLNKNLAQK
jgi:hypothetical protein